MGVGVASTTDREFAVEVVDAAASAAVLGVRRDPATAVVGVDGAAMMSVLAAGVADAALRAEATGVAAALRTRGDFAVDGEACERAAADAVWPVAGPESAPVSAVATAAPATMAAPTPSVTAPALSHIRAPGFLRGPETSG